MNTPRNATERARLRKNETGHCAPPLSAHLPTLDTGLVRGGGDALATTWQIGDIHWPDDDE